MTQKLAVSPADRLENEKWHGQQLDCCGSPWVGICGLTYHSNLCRGDQKELWSCILGPAVLPSSVGPTGFTLALYYAVLLSNL